MNNIKKFIAISLIGVLAYGCQETPEPKQEYQKPKYAADVPESLLTPNKIKTDLLGDLEFFDGLPNEATVQKAYDFLDLSRGAEAFLNGMPAVSIYAFLEGLKDAGLEPGDMGITEDLLDARGLLLTAQSTTPYAFTEIDLKDGPVVIEIPGPVLGILDDAFFRYVSDIGLVGPDQGKGGKYLIIGPDYKGEIPEGYFVAKLPLGPGVLLSLWNNQEGFQKSYFQLQNGK